MPGNDGSPTSNTSGKDPFKIQGIELMLGMYEVPADVTLNQDAEQYTVYANRKAADIASGGSGTNPVTLGNIPKDTKTNWDYVAELNWDANSQESYMLGKTFGASSSTAYRAAYYRNGADTTSGWHEWRAFGALSSGGSCGFACAALNNGLGFAYWAVGARACGSGGNRGEFTPA